MKKTENNVYFKVAVRIIIVLLVVIIGLLALPRMNDAREKSFRIEATKIIDSTKDMVKVQLKKKVTNFEFFENGKKSCHEGVYFCTTISNIKDLGFYKSDNNNYVGKVLIDFTNGINPDYILYLKKSNDLKIINGIREDYVSMGYISPLSWDEKYETCNCNADFNLETEENVNNETTENN